EPSVIKIDRERAQYWLGVGAQPSEPVLALLKVTGDWQLYKGEEGAEGTLRDKETQEAAEELIKAAADAADLLKAKAPEAKAKTEEPAPEADAPAEEPAAEAPAEEAAEGAE